MKLSRFRRLLDRHAHQHGLRLRSLMNVTDQETFDDASDMIAESAVWLEATGQRFDAVYSPETGVYLLVEVVPRRKSKIAR